ncbi:MAG: LytR C-terminal domain-containing protein, partial [Solirubrobacteraceae bacterium]
AMVLAAGLVVVIIVVALLILTSSGGGSSKTAGAQQSRATNVPASHRSKSKVAAAVNPAAVTVTVLNGTSTTNLAHDISSKLTTAGYKPGTIATATNQTVSSTIVAYLPNDRSDALAVAKSLKLGTGSVQAVDQSTRTVACNGSSTACSAQVVVTVGTDLASNG